MSDIRTDSGAPQYHRAPVSDPQPFITRDAAHQLLEHRDFLVDIGDEKAAEGALEMLRGLLNLDKFDAFVERKARQFARTGTL